MKKITGEYYVSKKTLIALTAACLLLAMLLPSCGGGTTPTPTSTSTQGQVSETALSYNCINPKGTPSSGSAPKRIIFNGTLDAAQDFFGATTDVASLGNAPITSWTDGLPVIVPTEQKVKEMLTGTTHKSTEKIAPYSKDASGKWVQSKTAATFAPSGWTATVEQAATNAVMAGCKPEYLPIVLAMASGGLNF